MGNFLSICSVNDFDWNESLFGNKKKKRQKFITLQEIQNFRLLYLHQFL